MARKVETFSNGHVLNEPKVGKLVIGGQGRMLLKARVVTLRGLLAQFTEFRQPKKLSNSCTERILWKTS